MVDFGGKHAFEVANVGVVHRKDEVGLFGVGAGDLPRTVGTQGNATAGEFALGPGVRRVANFLGAGGGRVNANARVEVGLR